MLTEDKTDDGCNSLRGSPLPKYSSPAPLAQALPDLEYPDDSDIERQPSRQLRLFGLSTEDAILVARYLDWTPVVEAVRFCGRYADVLLTLGYSRL